MTWNYKYKNTVSDTKAIIEKFNKYTNVRLFLNALTNGSLIRQALGRVVQLYSLYLGYSFIKIWWQSFQAFGDLNFLGGLALIIWQLTSLVAVFLCLKVVFLRGSDIVELPDSDYTVTPIVAAILTMHGEIAFLFLGIMSIPAMLAVWFGLVEASYPILTYTIIGEGFLAGIKTFFGFIIAGFLSYCLTRYIREWTIAIFSIADNVSAIHKDRNKNID